MAPNRIPTRSIFSDAESELLKIAQTELGEWHDRVQWLAWAEQETDLQSLSNRWQEELESAEQRADRILLVLENRLTKAVA